MSDRQPRHAPSVPAVGWAAAAVEQVRPGISRQVVHGARQTVIRYVYEPGAVFPAHSHPQEQVTIVLQGTIEFNLNGETVQVTAGEIVLIPGNLRHGARVLGNELVETINTLSPRRDDHPGG